MSLPDPEEVIVTKCTGLPPMELAKTSFLNNILPLELSLLRVDINFCHLDKFAFEKKIRGHVESFRTADHRQDSLATQMSPTTKRHDQVCPNKCDQKARLENRKLELEASIMHVIELRGLGIQWGWSSKTDKKFD
uniref:Uncharacterized protein n=1 Tax=Romanomermis culicivorax TaxID=13658 RepID=A0A915I721_ROMCU